MFKSSQDKWNLRLLFRSDNDPRIDKELRAVEKATMRFVKKWQNRKDYLEKPAILKQALDEYEQWARFHGTDGKAGYYLWLRTSQDQLSPKLKAKYNKVSDLTVKLGNQIQFFHLRLAKIPPKAQKRMLNYKGLAPYRHYLERVFQDAKYLLSEPEEKILNLKSKVAHENWVDMTSSFLSKEQAMIKTDTGKKQKKSFEELKNLMESQNKSIRDSAAKAFNDILKKRVEVAETELNSILENKKINDELRRFPRPDFARHLADDISSKTVDALVKAVAGSFSISRRYYAFKAKLFKVKKLQYHERNVPFGKTMKKYSFAQAVQLVQKVFSKLDPEFAEILERFLKNRQFDVFPYQGKASGAFCAHHLVSHPTFILLNYDRSLHDILTLAHEMGHGLNNELMKQKQNALNFGAVTSTAEVASTFMEDFVLQEILNRADDELKLAVAMMKLNSDVSTIFRQIAFYRFEQELHQEFRRKNYLSQKEIGSMFQKHMTSYMGPAVEQSPGSENWWIYVSHFRSFFYVYSYASGLLVSKSLQKSVKQNPAFINKVKEFLSAGTSNSPERIFRRLGVNIKDPNFWRQGIAEVKNLLEETIKLARKLKKI